MGVPDTPPTNYNNLLKTGNLLFQAPFAASDDVDPASWYTSRVNAAVGYIQSNWNAGISSWYGGWKQWTTHNGKPMPWLQATYNLMKGFQTNDIDTITVGGNDIDWFGGPDQIAERIIAVQDSDGKWYADRWGGSILATAWALLTLEKVAPPPPVNVEIILNEEICDDDSAGYTVTVNYSVENANVDGTLVVKKDAVVVDTVPLVNFTGTATWTNSGNVNVAGTYTWSADLDVAVGGGIPSHADDSASIDVIESPVVGDIPDQTTPFTTFDLDDYLTYGGDLAVPWSASTPPAGWSVTIEHDNIEPDNVATVTAPEGATDPVTITFTASVEGSDVTCSDSDDATFTPEIQVAVDVKPTSCRNPLNVGSKGVLPVAILGTEGYDVTQIDLSTITLEGVSPIRSAIEDVATPYVPFIGKEDAFDCTDEGPDGFVDLTLKFDKQAVVAALGEVNDGDVLVLKLTGNMIDETPIRGEDVIVILKKGKEKAEAKKKKK